MVLLRSLRKLRRGETADWLAAGRSGPCCVDPFDRSSSTFIPVSPVDDLGSTTMLERFDFPAQRFGMTFVSRCSVNISNTVEVQGIYSYLDPPVSYGELSMGPITKAGG